MSLNLSPLIEHRQAFWRLRQARYFRQVAIDPLGGLYWPEGEDIAPDRLEHYAQTQQEVMILVSGT